MAYKRASNRKLLVDIVKQGIRIKIGDYKIYKGILFINRKLYIPDASNVRAKVLRTIHDTPPIGHTRRISTYMRTSSYYF